MNKQIAILTLVFSVFLLVSFSTDPPNGKTGAPGDSICSECHKPQSQTLNGTISIEGFPDIITPGDTFVLTIVNRNTEGDAVRGGFQMTVLGPFNTRAGTLQNPSANSNIQIANSRQYFEHKGALTYPDSNVVRWTVEWIANNLPASGEITAYIAGNIGNGNFQSSGDRTVTSIVKGTILLSSIEDPAIQNASIYPNPGTTTLSVELENDKNPQGTVYFYNTSGVRAGQARMDQGKVEVPSIPSGFYALRIASKSEIYFQKWIKI